MSSRADGAPHPTGRVPAFINYNLTDKGLEHCINVAKPKLVLYESDLAPAIADIAASLRTTNPALQFARWEDRFSANGGGKEKIAGGVDGEVRLDEGVLSRYSAERIPNERRSEIKWSSPCCLIYTSGSVLRSRASCSRVLTFASSQHDWLAEGCAHAPRTRSHCRNRTSACMFPLMVASLTAVRFAGLDDAQLVLALFAHLHPDASRPSTRLHRSPFIY